MLLSMLLRIVQCCSIRFEAFHNYALLSSVPPTYWMLLGRMCDLCSAHCFTTWMFCFDFLFFCVRWLTYCLHTSVILWFFVLIGMIIYLYVSLYVCLSVCVCVCAFVCACRCLYGCLFVCACVQSVACVDFDGICGIVGVWVCSVVLRYAYLHTPVRPWAKCPVRFSSRILRMVDARACASYFRLASMKLTICLGSCAALHVDAMRSLRRTRKLGKCVVGAWRATIQRIKGARKRARRF